jgi:hypothetical protein
MTCKKNPEKIEGMASWLILGGLIPLAAAVVAQRDSVITIENFFTPERYPYLIAIALGAASLLVKRTSKEWRVIVGLAALSFLSVIMLSIVDFSIAAVGSIIWAIGMLFLIFKQYRFDLKQADKFISS